MERPRADARRAKGFQPRAQLAGRFVRECHRDNTIQRSETFGQNCDHAANQGGGLTGAGGGLDDQGLVEDLADLVARALIGQSQCTHGRSRTSLSGLRRAWFLRETRMSS